MEVLAKSIKFSKKLRIIPIGDIHWGNPACDNKEIDQLLNWILKKEDTYMLGMGDYIDGVTWQDKRFSGKLTAEAMDDLTYTLNRERDMIVKKFEPLAEAGKIIGLLEGNHEYMLGQRYSFNMMGDVCSKRFLNVTNLGYSCFIRLSIQKKNSPDRVKNVIIYAHHGFGGGRKPGAALNRMADAMTNYDADILLSGHDHQKSGKRMVRLGITSKGTPKVTAKPVIIGKTGTFLRTADKGQTTYSERFGFPPTDVGSIKITIEFKGKDKELEMHISE